jgi:hypothetical protein
MAQNESDVFYVSSASFFHPFVCSIIFLDHLLMALSSLTPGGANFCLPESFRIYISSPLVLRQR